MWTRPEPGDILWCRFPLRTGGAPGPKPRPALALAVEEFEDEMLVTAAYGTSQKLDHLRPGEFALRKAEHPAAFDLAGLSLDTKFDLGNTHRLPWIELYFGVPPQSRFGQHPKLGTLHPSMLRAAGAALRAIQRNR